MCIVCTLTNDSLKSILHPESLQDLININSSNNVQNNNKTSSDLDREYGNFSPTSIIFDTSNTYEGFNDLTSNEYINGLLSGSRWDNISSDSATITTELKYYLYDNESLPIDGVSYQTLEIKPEEINAINYSFESFSNVADITFTQTTSANEAHIAWLLFETLDEIEEDLAGFAFFPKSEYEEAGYIFMNASLYSEQNSGSTREVINNSLDRGSAGYITFPHELGHALGLKHPHDNLAVNINNQVTTYNTFPGLNDGDKYLGGSNGLNASPWTIMTYNENTSGNEYSPSSPKAFGGFLLGIGAFDIASMQYMYGPNINYNQGNNTYILDSNLNGYQCIWDAGGVDEIDASSASSSVNIDLRNATLQNELGGGGFVSKLKDSYKGFTIAYNSTGDCVIENAIGSSHNDNLIGNDFDNNITGGAGDDTISGGKGNDNIDGGEGNDSFLLDLDSNDYLISTVSLNNSYRITDNKDEIDLITNVEKIIFNDIQIDAGSIDYLTESESLTYLASHPDLIKAFGLKTLAATNHYYNFGQAEGRSIDAFNATNYLEKYGDLSATFGNDEISAVKHYIQFGFKEGRTSPSLSETQALNYIAANPDLINAFGIDTASAISHYDNFGKLEERSLTSFSASDYLSKYSDLSAAFGNNESLALKHFIQSGYAEGRTASSESSSDSSSSSNFTVLEAYNYIASNPDLISVFGIDIEAAKSHYINHGKAEGRSLTSFSASDYLSKYSDLSAAFGNDETLALKHYIQSGYAEGRTLSSSSSDSSTSSPTALSDFEALNYIASHSDLISVFGTNTSAASSHYVSNGYAEGRAKDNFDEWGYLASNNDLIKAFGSNTSDAIKHYISYGKSEGRSTNIFNAESYLHNNGDLKSTFGNDHDLAKKHFIEHGFAEGRVF